MPTVYKIRHSNGTYSSGGESPRFDKKGKTWSTKGALSNHLGLIRSGIYNGCVVVEIEVIHREVGTTPVQTMLKAKADARAKKQAQLEAERKAIIEASERAQLLKLQAKYP